MFCRLIWYNRPIYLSPLALVTSFVAGSLLIIFIIYEMKIFFIFFSNPLWPFKIDDEKARFYILVLALTSIATFISTFVSRAIYGVQGENMMNRIRRELFSSILWKHIGWFDLKKNSPHQLQTLLSTEVNLLSGVSPEAIGYILEGLCGFIFGLIVGLIYSWKIGLVTIAILPLFFASNFI